jgi:hypothetical protein
MEKLHTCKNGRAVQGYRIISFLLFLPPFKDSKNGLAAMRWRNEDVCQNGNSHPFFTSGRQFDKRIQIKKNEK